MRFLYHKYNDKLNQLWYSVDDKTREKDLINLSERTKKQMTAMIRMDYLNTERHQVAPLRSKYEWSLILMRPSEHKPGRGFCECRYDCG